MQPVPSPITNVTLHLYDGKAIAEELVWKDGTGLYSVGSLTTNVFYNLSLESGDPVNGGPSLGKRYYATYVDASGNKGQSPWLHCLRGGSQPLLGRTISAVGVHDVRQTTELEMELQLHEVAVVRDSADPAEEIFIEGAKAVALYTGPLDARWTVTVTGGRRVNELKVGDEVYVCGLDPSGQRQAVPTMLYTVDAGDPAGFSSKGQ